MPRKKIVAYRVGQRHGDLVISAMTESLRGTRVLAGSRVIRTRGMSKEEEVSAIEMAFKSLQGDS